MRLKPIVLFGRDRRLRLELLHAVKPVTGDMLIFSLLLMFVCITALSFVLAPVIIEKSGQMHKDQAQMVVGRVDRYLSEEQVKSMYKLALLGPVILGIIGFLFFPEGRKLAGLIAGSVLGYILPRFYVGHLLAARKKKFNDQLVDSIMIMSSSFRGGLSLVQAVESVADEMPEPAKGEFGVVLGENKMGVALDESLNRLYKRVPSPALQQMVTAIVLARETGGNLPLIFSRIVNGARERKKIEQSMQTLTVQGKIQAVVMTGLPVFFFFTVSGTNPHFFDVMFNSPRGREMLMVCVVLWILGSVSIWKISTFKDV
jgi:tight adherence protein B